MQKKTGVHFYINIANFDDVAEKEEAVTREVKHSIHELDTFFSSVEAYGLKHYPGLFIVEKITGSRLHMYVVSDSIPKTCGHLGIFCLMENAMSLTLLPTLERWIGAGASGPMIIPGIGDPAMQT